MQGRLVVVLALARERPHVDAGLLQACHPPVQVRVGVAVLFGLCDVLDSRFQGVQHLEGPRLMCILSVKEGRSHSVVRNAGNP
eukprot:5523930-Pyramimonas_sp.AAC.1